MIAPPDPGPKSVSRHQVSGYTRCRVTLPKISRATFRERDAERKTMKDSVSLPAIVKQAMAQIQSAGYACRVRPVTDWQPWYDRFLDWFDRSHANLRVAAELTGVTRGKVYYHVGVNRKLARRVDALKRKYDGGNRRRGMVRVDVPAAVAPRVIAALGEALADDEENLP